MAHFGILERSARLKERSSSGEERRSCSVIYCLRVIMSIIAGVWEKGFFRGTFFRRGSVRWAPAGWRRAGLIDKGGG